MPHASLAFVDGADHLVQLDAAAELSAQLTRWLRDVAVP